MAKATDDALQTALAQFNEGLKVQEAQQRAQRAIDKAERKKQQAATELKKVESSADATTEDKAEAEAAYRACVDEWNQLRSGETEEQEVEEQEVAAAVEAGPETDADDAKPEEPAADPEPEPSAEPEPEPEPSAQPEPSAEPDPDPDPEPSAEPEPEPEEPAVEPDSDAG